MHKKSLVRGLAAFALALGPLLVNGNLAHATDQQDAYNSLVSEYTVLWGQGKSAEALAIWDKAQSCYVSNSCASAVAPVTNSSPAPSSSSTPAPSASSAPAPSASSAPAPSANATTNPVVSAPTQSSAPLLTYDEYVKQVQAIDAKLVSSTGSDRTALLNQKNSVVAQYQTDNAKAQQKYVAVQQEYVQQLAVITAKNQAEAQAKLIETAKQEALSAGVSSNQLSSWTAVQTDLQEKVAQLEQVISNYDAIYTAESIATMNLDTVDQTVSQAVAYKEELKQQSLSLSSVAMDSLSTVKAASLTSEQKEVLVTAASISFEYAQQGTPVYNQAMEALFTVAESDDPTLLPEVAAIPLIGQALDGLLDAFNYLGNVGSDMSPQVREQSEKVVVSAVIVAQVTQVAVGATTISSATASVTGAAVTRRP